MQRRSNKLHIFAAALALLALAACGAPVPGEPAATEAPRAGTGAPTLSAPLSPTALSPASTPFTSTLPVVTNQSPASFFQSVIFDEGQAAQLDIASHTGMTADGYWTPSFANVVDLETALPAYLQGPDGQPYPDILPRLHEYTRQYAGITSGERRLVFANFFCRDLGINWRQEYVDVQDGGDCFFRILYDVNSGEFSGLSVNGEA